MAAAWLFTFAFGLILTWTFGYAHGFKAFKDEGLAIFVGSIVLGVLAIGLLLLASLLRNGRLIGFNASLWSVVGLFWPRAARRARMLKRDRRDGLL